MASRLLTRAEIGLVPWECRVLYSGYEALTVHYPGPSPWTQGRSVGGRGIDRSSPAAFRDSCDHRYCPIIWRGYQAFHMGPERNGCDIFYSSGICPHGVRLEGRGPGVKSGAQGTTEGNRRSVGIQYMGGITSGGVLDPLTDEAKNAYYDEAARFNRALRWGHKDWLDAQGRVRTACPGGLVYAWRQAGFPRPAIPTPTPPPPPPEEDDMPYFVNAPNRALRLVTGGVAILFPTNELLSGVRDAHKTSGIPERIVNYTDEQYDYVLSRMVQYDDLTRIRSDVNTPARVVKVPGGSAIWVVNAHEKRWVQSNSHVTALVDLGLAIAGPKNASGLYTALPISQDELDRIPAAEVSAPPP